VPRIDTLIKLAAGLEVEPAVLLPTITQLSPHPITEIPQV